MKIYKIIFLILFVLGANGAVAAAINCPNRPSGAVTVLETPFNTLDGEGQLWEVYPGAGRITQPTGVLGTASTSILAPGQAVGGQQTIWPKPGKQQPLNNLYLCMRWKMNKDFVGLRTNNKLVFMAAQDFTYGRPGINGLLSVPGRGYPPASFQMTFAHNTAGLNNAHACTGTTGEICYPNVKDTPLYTDTWYTVEAYVKSSTCSTCRNGTVMWWVNGTLQANYTNLNYGSGILNQWQINHTWDSSLDKQCGPPTHPANTAGRDCRKEQAHYFDHVILASVGGTSTPNPTPTPPPVPQPTPVPPPPPPASYKTTMRAQHSEKCVDAGASTADGVSLTQQTCNGAKNQNFIFTPKTGGFYEIRSEYSGKCVTHLNSSPADGAKLVQSTCNEQNTQLFSIENLANGRKKVHSKVNGKCMDVSGISTFDGAEVFLWTCWNGLNENFTINVP